MLARSQTRLSSSSGKHRRTAAILGVNRLAENPLLAAFFNSDVRPLRLEAILGVSHFGEEPVAFDLRFGRLPPMLMSTCLGLKAISGDSHFSEEPVAFAVRSERLPPVLMSTCLGLEAILGDSHFSEEPVAVDIRSTRLPPPPPPPPMLIFDSTQSWELTAWRRICCCRHSLWKTAAAADTNHRLDAILGVNRLAENLLLSTFVLDDRTRC